MPINSAAPAPSEPDKPLNGEILPPLPRPPMAAQRPALDPARVGFIKAHRAQWIAALPVELQQTQTYAVYDHRKAPFLCGPVINNGALYNANGNNHDTLSALVGVTKALERMPDALVGPALRLTTDARTVVIDLDNPHKTFARLVEQEPARRAELEAQRDKQIEINQLVLNAFIEAGALVMLSQSGQGVHIAFQCSSPDKNLPVHNGKFTFCGDVLSHDRFVYLTGEQLPTARQFTSADNLPNLTTTYSDVFGPLLKAGHYRPHMGGYDEHGAKFEVLTTTEHGRRLDLSDEAVLAKLARKSWTRPVYEFLTTGAPKQNKQGLPDVSLSIRDAVGDMDKITGDPLQIERIILNSAGVALNPTKEGKTREAKTISALPANLRQARMKNNAHRRETAVKDEEARSHLAAAEAQLAALNVRFTPEELVKIDPAHMAQVAFCTDEQLAQYRTYLASLPAPVVTASEAEPGRDEETEASGDDTLPVFRLELPPGMAGVLAAEFMQMQHYTNKTIAIAWALNILSGFAQRSYHINGTGVNTYLMLLGYTGTGKEKQVEARVRLERSINAAGRTAIHFDKVHGPAEFSSGVALLKHVMFHRRCSSIIGEASFLFENMGNATNEHMSDLKRRMLALRTKAGPDGRAEKKVYANAKDNVEPCDSPALSLLCEGQPARFYAALTPDDAADGLCNRFEILNASVKSRGLRNKATRRDFSPALVATLRYLVERTVGENDPGSVVSMQEVSISPAAQGLFDLYETNVVDRLNVERDKIEYELFVRSLVSSMVYAALLAIADSADRPVISNAHAGWALDFIFRERSELFRQFNESAIGKDSNTRKALLIEALRQLQATRYRRCSLTEQQHKIGMIQYFAISHKLSKKSAYKDDRFNTTADHIQDALKALEREQVIKKLNAGEIFRGVTAPESGENYAILDLGRNR